MFDEFFLEFFVGWITGKRINFQFVNGTELVLNLNHQLLGPIGCKHWILSYDGIDKKAHFVLRWTAHDCLCFSSGDVNTLGNTISAFWVVLKKSLQETRNTDGNKYAVNQTEERQNGHKDFAQGKKKTFQSQKFVKSVWSENFGAISWNLSNFLGQCAIWLLIYRTRWENGNIHGVVCAFFTVTFSF